MGAGKAGDYTSMRECGTDKVEQDGTSGAGGAQLSPSNTLFVEVELHHGCRLNLQTSCNNPFYPGIQHGCPASSTKRPRACDRWLVFGPGSTRSARSTRAVFGPRT